MSQTKTILRSLGLNQKLLDDIALYVYTHPEIRILLDNEVEGLVDPFLVHTKYVKENVKAFKNMSLYGMGLLSKTPGLYTFVAKLINGSNITIKISREIMVGRYSMSYVDTNTAVALALKQVQEAVESLNKKSVTLD